ncbi:MAG: cytochrome C [Rhodoferax sp.]|nr:cytochrome C [Rhodoferax sp.]
MRCPQLFRHLARAFLPSTMFVLASLAPLTASSQGIESVMSPGQVIQGHAKLEGECKECHVKFDRKAQSTLCAACHKEVGADVKNKTGYHGTLKPQACNECHTDHKGRNEKIASFDKKKFDHKQTDFLLKGKHEPLACEKCHEPTKKYREASQQCNDCHKKDDTHKGSLGPKCGDCHIEKNWKEARFDHSKTKFALEGKHVDVKCTDCHKLNKYKDTPKECVACHKKDDDSTKGHKGQYGQKCESCHGVKAWKPSTFHHDTDTKYVLRGKHITATCASCHKGPLYKEKLKQDCNSCHAKDDKHKETLGKDCESCHTERSWKEPARPKFDHDKSSFPLLGKHIDVKCDDCHKSAMFKEAPKDCYSCHKKDDKHKGTLGEKCEECHGERDWKTTTGRFEHDKTKFKLRNAHAEGVLKCVSCHKDLTSYRKTATECYSCHKKDDKHEGQAGKECGSCHTDKNWKVEKFDHGLTKFPLTGRHITATCKSCHETTRYKDAPKECYACHKKEDKHKLKLGERCENCHNARSWKLWDFNHDKRTKYVLDGAHRKVACESCHKDEAPKGKDAAPVGSNCNSCHQREDVHDGQFGVRCEQCHVSENWKLLQSRAGNGFQLQNRQGVTP